MSANFVVFCCYPTITRSRFGTSHEGFSPSWDVWYHSWEVVPPPEASGGFDFSRGKNQTKVTSHEEQHLTRDNTKLYHFSRGIKTIPSWHLTRDETKLYYVSRGIKTIPSQLLTSLKPYHLNISRGMKPNYTTSHEGSKPYHLDFSRGMKPNYTTSHEGSKPYHREK